MTTNKSPLYDLISFAMQLTPEQLAALNRLTKDPEDTIHLLSDLSTFGRFLNDYWNATGTSAESPRPKAPPLTSRYLRSVLHAAADELDVAANWIAKEARGYLAQDTLAVAK